MAVRVRAGCGDADCRCRKLSFDNAKVFHKALMDPDSLSVRRLAWIADGSLKPRSNGMKVPIARALLGELCEQGLARRNGDGEYEAIDERLLPKPANRPDPHSPILESLRSRSEFSLDSLFQKNIEWWEVSGDRMLIDFVNQGKTVAEIQGEFSGIFQSSEFQRLSLAPPSTLTALEIRARILFLGTKEDSDILTNHLETVKRKVAARDKELEPYWNTTGRLALRCLIAAQLAEFGKIFIGSISAKLSKHNFEFEIEIRLDECDVLHELDKMGISIDGKDNAASRYDVTGDLVPAPEELIKQGFFLLASQKVKPIDGARMLNEVFAREGYLVCLSEADLKSLAKQEQEALKTYKKKITAESKPRAPKKGKSKKKAKKQPKKPPELVTTNKRGSNIVAWRLIAPDLQDLVERGVKPIDAIPELVAKHSVLDGVLDPNNLANAMRRYRTPN